MTNEQIINKLKVEKQMLGEYASRMDPLAGDDDLKNMRLHSMFEACMAEIDRLERTLSVRDTAKSMIAA